LIELVSGEVAGDPTNGRCWIRSSLHKLTEALSGQEHSLCRETIRRLLLKHQIRPRSNVKRLSPKAHPDRDRQFNYIQTQRQRFQAAGWPIISVDTKKKELIGPFRNPGRVWCQQAPEVYTHDFPSDAVGKAIPYGIYDVQHNLGCVYVGTSADTPDFAVACIVHWWQHVSCQFFPGAPEALILADAGGSNGYRPRRWKQQLQSQLVDAFGLAVTVCHYPPGASKWNPIDHRLFSQISKTWAGTPLTSFELVLECIRATETTTGLKVQAFLVEQHYETGLTVSDDEMAALALERHATCPAWNYTIRPRENGK
jgi:hypothetical protein